MLRKFSFILLSLFFLASCTSITPVTSSPPTVKRTWSERQQILSQINRFQLAGKIAFKSAHDAGSATLNWKENKGQYTVALYGPLGSNAVKISGQKNHVIMETSDGKKVQAQTPEELIAQELGYQLPVSYLKYWIRGIPVSYLPATTKLDSYQRLSQLKQNDWNVTFGSYTNVGNIDLPNRINITSQQLNAKIIIYNWQY